MTDEKYVPPARCPWCGTRMYGSWRYCAKCGARVVMTNGD